MHGLSNVVSYFRLTPTLTIPHAFNKHDKTVIVKTTLYNIFFIFDDIFNIVKVTNRAAICGPSIPCVISLNSM